MIRPLWGVCLAMLTVLAAVASLPLPAAGIKTPGGGSINGDRLPPAAIGPRERPGSRVQAALMHDAMRCRRATVTVRPVVRAAVMIIGLAVSLAVLPHAEGQGATDAFVWVRQFGTPSDDSGSAVAVDATGTLLSTGQFGSPDFDPALAVAADGTGTYVAGRTEGTIPGQTSLGSVDAFVRKYNVDGNVSNVSWTHQFGTSGYDYASGLAVDATGVYVAGTTSGSFPGETLQGSTDAFVRKYDARGEVLWTRQFGTSAYAAALAVAADATGVDVTGLVGRPFPGAASAGGAATVLRKD